MPYKDEGVAREKAAERQRKHREGVTKGVTGQGVTSGGVTEPWYPNKPTDKLGNPITPVILSDGQKWYPYEKSKDITNNTGLPDRILKDMIRADLAYGHITGQPSLKERIRKALEYQEWAKGQPRPGVLGVTG